jgi:protein-L-isoaspartate(D-aspartate) O-methyltransferase
MGRRLSTLIDIWAGLLLLLVSCTPETQIPPSQTGFEQPPSVEDKGVDVLATDEAASYAEARERMVQEGIVEWGVEDEDVIAAMGIVPRHEFVPTEYLDRAYANHPLPIGYGQTISQPYIVALMTQELDVGEGDHVLEIGTGSGYQAAVLAQLGVTVYTIEIIGPLAKAASQRLDGLGYSDVHVRHDDGYFGWEEEAPFDAVIVTAAPDHVPQPLLDQLKIGGVLVIPVGPVGGYQELWRIARISETEYQSTSLGGVRFVPLTREVREE